MNFYELELQILKILNWCSFKRSQKEIFICSLANFILNENALSVPSTFEPESDYPWHYFREFFSTVAVTDFDSFKLKA